MNIELTDRRILVIGGGGFIGQHIVTQLKAVGADVAVMDMVAPPGTEYSETGWVVGNITDEALLASVVAGRDTVIFLANVSLPASANADLAAEVQWHVRTTVKAAEICEAEGVERFLFASSGGTVYGIEADRPLAEDFPTMPRNAYGVSKLSIEHYLRVIGLLKSMRTTSLRISNPYGEGQRAYRGQGFIAAAMEHVITEKPLPIWGDGSVERDFIHVSDVAHAFVSACARTDLPDIINIGSGQSVSLLKIITLIEQVMDKKLCVVFEHERSIDTRKNVLNITRAKEVLDWSPAVSISDGLQRTAKWWKTKYQKL